MMRDDRARLGRWAASCALATGAIPFALSRWRGGAMATSDEDRSEAAYRAFPPATWGLVAFGVAVGIGLITGVGVMLFGQSVAPSAENSKLQEAAWAFGIAAGSLFFATSITISKAARRLMERGRAEASSSQP